MLYIWLTKDAEESDRLQGIKVKSDNTTGKLYVQFYDDVLDPTVDVTVPEELIEKVTLREEIFRGLRAEGLYQHEDATLLVKTRVVTSTVVSNVPVEIQTIGVVAPTLDKLFAIYTLVRQCKLEPEENWDDVQNSSSMPESEEPKAETTA